MTVKGFPSNKKNALVSGRSNEFATVVPTDPYRNALDTPRFAFRVDSSTVPRTATVDTGIESTESGQIFWVGDTATPAKVGDFVRFQDGAAQFIEFPVIKVETNRFLISCVPDDLQQPADGDEFYIMRYATQRVDEAGSQVVIAEQGPTQFVLDGNPVEVEEDTVDTSNNKPLPVKIFNNAGLPADIATETTLSAINTKTPALGQALAAASTPVVLTAIQVADLKNVAVSNFPATQPVSGPLTDTQLRATPVPVSGTVAVTGVATEATLAAMSGKFPATIGQKTAAASLGVVLASDQGVIPVSPSAGASGSSPGSTTVSTVATITAPANALGFILMNLDTSTTNMRYRIGATAATNSGQQLQPGRDTGYIPCGANISIIAESGTCSYDIQWVVR